MGEDQAMQEHYEKAQLQHIRSECLRFALETFRPPVSPDGDSVLALAKTYAEWVLGG